jgi:hypothetical protein
MESGAVVNFPDFVGDWLEFTFEKPVHVLLRDLVRHDDTGKAYVELLVRARWVESPRFDTFGNRVDSPGTMTHPNFQHPDYIPTAIFQYVEFEMFGYCSRYRHSDLTVRLEAVSELDDRMEFEYHLTEESEALIDKLEYQLRRARLAMSGWLAWAADETGVVGHPFARMLAEDDERRRVATERSIDARSEALAATQTPENADPVTEVGQAQQSPPADEG